MHTRAVRPFVTLLVGGLALVLALGLALAAAALAAKPKHNARFKGTTSGTAIQGFKPPVTFKVAANGLSLAHFTFGSIGCFGGGGFRPGVDPWTGHSLIDAGKVKVSAAGKVSAKATSSFSVAGQTTTTTIAITARFSSPKKAGGTIKFSQVFTGGGFTKSCTSDPITFTATAH